MALSRTHVSYLNDGTRTKKFLAQLKEEINNDSIVLDLNGNSLMGLAASKFGAKAVYIFESSNLNIGILQEYITTNELENVHFISEVTDDIVKNVTTFIADPNFASAILPWENLKMAYVLFKHKTQLYECVSIIPECCEIWAMPVEFQDLHKIAIPLGKCEGIDMGVFDRLVEVGDVYLLIILPLSLMPAIIFVQSSDLLLFFSMEKFSFYLRSTYISKEWPYLKQLLF